MFVITTSQKKHLSLPLVGIETQIMNINDEYDSSLPLVGSVD